MPNLAGSAYLSRVSIAMRSCYIPPMRRLLTLPVLLFAGSAFAADYATCRLDKLPGVKNAPAHAAALNLCAHQPRGGAH